MSYTKEVTDTLSAFHPGMVSDQPLGKSSIINRKALNLIRTTKRNNIELKNIADNKANILMSLNALMVTFLIPIVLTHMDIIREGHLYIPLIIMVTTCFIVIYICAIVLKPFNIRKNVILEKDTQTLSPFFFGNYYKMKSEDYMVYVQDTLQNQQHIDEYILKDLYFIGKTLGIKYNQIRWSYIVFMTGLGATMLATLVVMAIG